MSTPTLSILVLSIETRKHFLDRLLAILRPQLPDDDSVELLTYVDDGDETIGAKRNAMLDAATGRYLCFVDDDDLVSPDYVSSILFAARSDPDVIGFRVKRMVDGRFDADAIISTRFEKWATETREGKRVYLRTPNHLSPVRREIALKHRFPAINHGEDAEYSRRIQGDLRSETPVSRSLYTYEFRSNPLRRGEKANGSKTAKR